MTTTLESLLEEFGRAARKRSNAMASLKQAQTDVKRAEQIWRESQERIDQFIAEQMLNAANMPVAVDDHDPYNT